MRRCMICDSQYFVGPRDNLCQTCRTSINKAKNAAPIMTEEAKQHLEHSEHYSMNHIDTSIADYKTKILQ